MMELEFEGKRCRSARAKKQRNMFPALITRTKMKRRAHAAIILFRAARSGPGACHKKAYDHALESARTSGVASVVVALPPPFGGGTIHLA
jgi:IS5 family transposase